MEFEQVKEYVDAVKDSDRFKKVLEFTRLTDLKPKEDLYENIRYYLSLFHARRDCEQWFQPDYNYFINFLEHYLKDRQLEMSFDENGYLDLSKTLHLVKPRLFTAGMGSSTDNHIMLANGEKYISKIPLNYPGGTGIKNKYCIFAPLIASFIAKAIEVEAAEITLAGTNSGRRILSKNFLKPNEELIVYAEVAEDVDEIMISEQLSKMEQVLRLRRYPEHQIEAARFESLKQELVAKIIGLRDQKPENSPVIIGVDEEGKRYARIAPMFDLDYSFQIGEERPRFVAKKCDNGQEDIASLIEQYKDYPGFLEFVQHSVQSLDMVQIFSQIHQETRIKAFENYAEDEQMKQFIAFVNNNLRTC